MSEWLIALISSGAAAVMLTWAFRWGKKGSDVNNRLENLEKYVADPPIRPDCSVIFTEIKTGLANLDGKVDTILATMTKNQKNNEKKHIQEKR